MAVVHVWWANRDRIREGQSVGRTIIELKLAPFRQTRLGSLLLAMNGVERGRTTHERYCQLAYTIAPLAGSLTG